MARVHEEQREQREARPDKVEVEVMSVRMNGAEELVN
jgi:hypothetical protein